MFSSSCPNCDWTDHWYQYDLNCSLIGLCATDELIRLDLTEYGAKIDNSKSMPLFLIGTDFDWTKYLSEHSSEPVPNEVFNMVCFIFFIGQIF